MWRIDQDERKFTDAQLLGWSFVLPYYHTPIMDTDREDAKDAADFLTKAFTKTQLAAAVKRLKLKRQ